MRPFRATYRLQMGPDGARGLLPYLADLGISHVNLSGGSVVPDGEGLRALADAAHERGMGLVLDVVPGHIELVADGVADGLRVEHPDGSADLVASLRDLRAGTTGHGFGSDVQALFVDPAGDPGRPTLPVAGFHAANAERHPLTVLSTSTHATDSSGDVRARIGALAGLGEDWAGAVRRWRADNAVLRSAEDGAPTPAEELLIYETLVGAWPIGMDRLGPHLVQALRGAGHGTHRAAPGEAHERAVLTFAGAAPGEAHERAVLAFAAALLEHGPFRYGFDGWAARVAEVGARAALGQTLLKLTCPGVPDVLQGDETTFLALADPDTRQTVDWAARREALSALQAGAAPTRETAKLHLVWSALRLRAELPEAFAGAYTPIPAGEGVCVFLRGDDVLVALTVRESVTGAAGWALPAVAAGTWVDVLDGAEHELPDGASLASVLGPDGRALLRRA